MGRKVWWRLRHADGDPWGLTGLWSTWTDKATGELVGGYTTLTLIADGHPIMSRMHESDPNLGADEQDKRSVVLIEMTGVDQWLFGTVGGRHGADSTGAGRGLRCRPGRMRITPLGDEWMCIP